MAAIAGLQTATAVFAIVHVAARVVVVVKHVVRAHEEAKTLYEKTLQLRALLESVYKILERRNDRVQRDHATKDDTSSLEDWIKTAVLACGDCLQELEDKLKDFATSDSRQVPGRLTRSLSHVISSDFLKNQESRIETHLQGLTLALGALQTFEQTATHSLVQQLLSLLQTVLLVAADEQQSPISKLLRVDAPDARQVLNAQLQESSALPRILEHSTEGPSTSASSSDVEREDEEADDLAGQLYTVNDSSISILDTSLMIAVKQNRDDVVRGLIENRQNVKVKDRDGWTLVHHAVSRNAYKSLCELLKSSEAQLPEVIDARDAWNQTALMMAARRADKQTSYKLAKALIDAGCDINVVDDEEKLHRSALYRAIEGPWNQERENFVQLLLDQRDPEIDIEPVLHPNIVRHVRKYPALQKMVSEQQEQDEKRDRGQKSRRSTFTDMTSSTRPKNILRRFSHS